MKKLLILFIFFSPLALLSQNKIVIKSTQVTISSLAPIAASTVVANATGGIATPTAVQLGVGLTFSAGKLAIDTANFKDTIYAMGGLSMYSPGFNRIGLGGFLSQNVNISGSNVWDFTIDSMPANVLHGFRVNFGSDAGYDMIYRDSATGRWTRGAKGTVGQVWTMLGAGGLGWANASGGGGGGGSLTRVNITSGTSSTATTNSLTKFNFSAAIAAYSLTFPASPSDQDVVEIQGGPTITLGNVEVTTLTMVANAGQTLLFNPNFILNSGGDAKFRYNATGTYWDQVYAH